MNYRTVKSLKGNTLCVGDLVGICSIGHQVENNRLNNLGGCGDLWVFDALNIYEDGADPFCKAITPDVSIDFTADTIRFTNLDSLTLVVLELMRMSEEMYYDTNFDDEE